jgi:hypothetical protein
MLSQYGANLMVGVLTGQQTMPTSLWLALLDTTAAADDTGTDIAAYEPTDPAYVRQEIPLDGLTSWTATTAGASLFTAPLIYSNADADWPILRHYALCTESVDGEVVLYAPLPYTVTIKALSFVTIPSNSLSVEAF